MILFPNCKINIGLDVLRRRADGYHDIETVMVPVSGLCDILEVVPSEEPGISMNSSGLALDCPTDDNLCVKAYRLMADRFPTVRGVSIHLHKVIPSGAGLGGGSADAAFTIKAINSLFGLALGEDKMESIAAELGSDTAFFIRNRPMMASGRGEILSPVDVPQIAGKRLLIVKPPIAVSTKQAYAGVIPNPAGGGLIDRVRGEILSWRDSISNAFEPSVFSAFPQIGSIKKGLYSAGAMYVSMSGSGSAVYGIFDKPISMADLNLPDSTFYYEQFVSTNQ